MACLLEVTIRTKCIQCRFERILIPVLPQQTCVLSSGLFRPSLCPFSSPKAANIFRNKCRYLRSFASWPIFGTPAEIASWNKSSDMNMFSMPPRKPQNIFSRKQRNVLVRTLCSSPILCWTIYPRPDTESDTVSSETKNAPDRK